MKKPVLYVTGRVLVSDFLAALEPMLPEELLDRLDEKLKARAADRISFDDTEIEAEKAIDELDVADLLPQPESFADMLDQGDVQDLAAAIRRGDKAQAELLLDRLFDNERISDGTVTEWVQRGRYGSKARAVVEPARKAA